MANVKQAHITGVMPFNISEDDEAAKWLGYLNGPAIGIRIRYGASHFVSNDRGGKTAMYEFEIVGHEALSFKGFQAMREAFENAGATIDINDVIDIEDGWT
jgi:hypothetical protein